MSDEERDRIEGECAEAMATTEWTGDVEPYNLTNTTNYPPDGPVNSPSVIAANDVLYDPTETDEYQKLKRENELLTAHLISKGYGHNAIKRILKGEAVR